MRLDDIDLKANWLICFSFFLIVIIMLCQCASAPPVEPRRSSANFYDDFNGNGISSRKWASIGPNFSQPGDGFLYFSGTGRMHPQLRSREVFSSGVFTMSFLDYWCDNDAPTSQQLGSLVGLGLGSGLHYVRIERGQVRADPMGSPNIGGYIEVNWQTPSEPWLHVEAIPSAITSGFLQIRYDGTRVSFYYRVYGAKTWVRVGPILAPGWEEAVPLFIQAVPGGKSSDRYTLRFKINDIEVDPVDSYGQ
jgi:hypothetical protein